LISVSIVSRGRREEKAWGGKIQVPDSKFQIIPKFQKPKSKYRRNKE
jgi:hypothetical protein